MKMKSFSGLFFVVCLFCAVIAFPTSNLDDDAEIVVVPLKEPQDQTNFGHTTKKDVNNFDGVIATDINPGFFSSTPINPYNWNLGFLDRFHDMIRQLRERVYNVWSEAPVDSETSENAPTVKSNSTSRIEYIDGHKVVINDTFYKKESDFGTAVYNVRIIDYLPLDDDEITNRPIDAKPELDVETIDNKTETKLNTDDEFDKGSPEELDNNDNENEINQDIDDVENFELDDDNNQQQQFQNQHQHHQRQQQQQHQQEQSLVEENYTNNRLEEFMPNSPPLPPSEHSWESIEDENENENVDMNEHYPVDLSNDIAINQMAADQGVPYDLDAEIFNVNEYIQHPISTTYEFVPIDIK